MVARRPARPPLTPARWAWILALVACSSRGAGFSDDAATVADAGPPTDQVIAADQGAPPVDAPPPADAGADAPPPPVDVGIDAPAPPVDRPPAMDAPAPPVDVPPPPVDRPVVDVPPAVDRPDVPAPVDAGPRGAYLDPCAANGDCASGDCLATAAGARWCTRRCAASAECGDGNLCGQGGRCVPDDTGARCNPAGPATCARRCLANSSGTAAHCTRECAVGADCPAGFACENTTSGTRLCVYVEHGCSASTDCASGQCLSNSAGGYNVCTSPCTSAADCPRRMTIDDGSGRPVALPPYTCQSVAGQMVCVPPLVGVGAGNPDVRGNHAIGESCALSAGNNSCYSGVCDSGENVCVQGCTPASGCPVGFACLPWIPGAAGTAQYLVCRPFVSGAGAIGATCGRSSDCATGACLPAPAGSPYCTRYCADGVCPTGLRCVSHPNAFDGTRLATCER